MRSGGDRGERKSQNEANLLLVLISGILRLRTNPAEIELENKPNFRPVASGEWRVASGEWRVASDEWMVVRSTRTLASEMRSGGDRGERKRKTKPICSWC